MILTIFLSLRMSGSLPPMHLIPLWLPQGQFYVCFTKLQSGYTIRRQETRGGGGDEVRSCQMGKSKRGLDGAVETVGPYVSVVPRKSLFPFTQCLNKIFPANRQKTSTPRRWRQYNPAKHC
jgi:hypothetical protein